MIQGFVNYMKVKISDNKGLFIWICALDAHSFQQNLLFKIIYAHTLQGYHEIVPVGLTHWPMGDLNKILNM